MLHVGRDVAVEMAVGRRHRERDQACWGNLLSQSGEGHAIGQVRCRRAKNVAAVKARADRMMPIGRVGQGNGSGHFFPSQHIAQDAVVRRDKGARPCAHGHRTPFGAHPGIDHDHVEGVRRPIGIGRHQHKPRVADVLWRDVMRNVGQFDVARDAADHALHRADVAIL